MWLSPKVTAGLKCVRCHDNGAFVRSPYLAQLKKNPHALPNTADGYSNQSTPVKFVGTDFAKQRSWSIRLDAPDSVDSLCVSCHRLAVSNSNNFQGSALEFAVVSTDRSQKAKNPHSDASPIWMTPTQKLFEASALAEAKKYQKCAQDFHSLNRLDTLQNAPETAKSPPGCIMTPLVEPWQP